MNEYNGFNLVNCTASEKLDGVNARLIGGKLVSKSDNIFPAPDWFLNQIPPQATSGELWAGRGQFEKVLSITQKADASEWHHLRFMIIDTSDPMPYASRNVETIQRTPITEGSLSAMYAHIIDNNGEGVVIRDQHGTDWKLKPQTDADARVIDYAKGKSDGIGSIVVQDGDGHRFKISSGLDFELRRNPPPIGSMVRFNYRGRTGRGIPRFPVFVSLRAESDFC